MDIRVFCKKRFFNKLFLVLLGLSVCILIPRVAMAQKKVKTNPNPVNSAWQAYNSVVLHINNGEVRVAKDELWTLLKGLEEGRFEECSDEHVVRLLQYNSHVVLANIAFAEKEMWDLDRELSFFNSADTTKSEWKRARFAATHFKHKYYQLSNGKFGKAVGDWVSPLLNSKGYPMVWIRVFFANNTLHAELKDCAMKDFLDKKYPHFTDRIMLDNVKNVIEMDFGDSRLMPGLQFLPSFAISTITDLHDMFSESIARQSIAKKGTPYTSEATFKQLGVDAAALLASALIAQLAVSKETVTSESFVMEEISPEVYMAKIKLRALTLSSDGNSKDEFQWAEIPMIHLYAQEEMDFSKNNVEESLYKTTKLLGAELWWDGAEEREELSESIGNDIINSFQSICNVENTSYDGYFYFLGKDINHKINSTFSVVSFTGLAQANSIWGFKGSPINPRTNRSEPNLNIVPLRGEFQAVISPYECVTFVGDWNESEKCGNGVMSYVNTNFPEFSFTYEGTMKKGSPHGLGIWQGDGFRYVGWFYEGERFGYGTMSYDDGREEQGFVTSFGQMIPEDMVFDAMKEDFNSKVNRISKHKYQALDDE